ncbi:hypothetical protein ABK040_003164 [Willaertia magna]
MSNQLIKRFFGGHPLRRMFSEFDKDLMNLMPMASSQSVGSFFSPPVDVKETDKEFIIQADVPGFNKDNIKCEIDEDRKMLKLSGEMKKEIEKKEENFLLQERISSSFMRNFDLPENADLKDVKCSLKDGQLELTIPKLQIEGKQSSKTRQIEIGE